MKTETRAAGNQESNRIANPRVIREGPRLGLSMRKIIITVLVLAVLAVGGWLARPAYRAHKERRFAQQARLALEQNQFRIALLNAQQTLVLNSNNLAACAVMAELADLSRSAHALSWRRRLAELAPTAEHRLAFAACALRYERAPFPLATQTLEELTGSATNSVAYHVTVAQLALRLGRNDEAARHFESALRVEPTNQLHRLNLAVVRLQSQDAAVSAQAHAELEKLQTAAQASPLQRLMAGRALVVHHEGRRQFAEAEQFSSVVLRDPTSAFADRLEHLAVLHAGKNPQFDSFLAGVQREAATNALAAADLITRLTELGRATNALAWVQTRPAAFRLEPPVPIAVANAQATAGRWREMEETLRGQSWKEQEFVREALLAYAVRQQLETNVASVHWRDAVRLATPRPEQLATLAQMATGWRWTSEAEAVLWIAARQFPSERWPLDSLQNGYMQMRNTRGLFEVNELLLTRQPANAIVQNNWATLALLLQTNQTRAHQLAQQVYGPATNNPGFVSTYAYSLHVQGRTAEALALMEALPTKDLETPALASYYGVLLAAAGQGEKARLYLARAETLPILPEELLLVAGARKKL